MGYSPWGRREADTTELLTLSQGRKTSWPPKYPHPGTTIFTIPPLKRQGGDRHPTAQRISGKEKARRQRGGPSVIQCRWTSWLDPGFAADESSLHFSSRDGLLEKHICTEAHPECHPKMHAPPLCCWVSRLPILLSTSSNFAQFFEPRVSAAQTIPSAEGSPLRPSSRPFSVHPSRSPFPPPKRNSRTLVEAAKADFIQLTTNSGKKSRPPSGFVQRWADL